MKKQLKISHVSLYAIFLTIILLLSVVSGFIYQKNKYAIGPVGTRIMEEIDWNNPEDCIIDLKTVTDFKWDKVVMVSESFLAAGYPNEMVSEMFGFPYEMPEGFRSRLIFLNENEIVYEESYAADIEHSSKFNISIQSSDYLILTSENC